MVGGPPASSGAIKMDAAVNTTIRKRTDNPARSARTRTMALALTMALIGVAAVSWLGRPSSETGASVAESGEAISVLEELTGIDRLITQLQTSNNATPTSSSTDLLGTLLLRRARLSGDAQSLAQAAVVADQAVALAPANVSARLLQARVRYSSHRFTDAATAAREVLLSEPQNPEALALLADASAEIGDYAAATSALSTLSSGTRSAALTVRLARRAFVQGDTATAKRLADEAIVLSDSSGVRASERAFYQSFAGQVAFDTGDHARSIVHYVAALSISPGDRAAAFGLARADAALGNVQAAIEQLEVSVDQFPDPVAYALLSDLYSTIGQPEQAQLARDLVLATAALAGTEQQIYDRQLVTFFADQKLQPDRALLMATAEVKSGRNDVYAYDALAWAAYRAGDLAIADDAARRALAQGTRDASMLAHAGLIAAANGRPSEAEDLLSTALSLNPAFHPIVADEAKSALAQLVSKG